MERLLLEMVDRSEKTPRQPTAGEAFHAGFIAIVGPPNAGKSTLLNRILGEKLSITSKKPQTTRNRILGVLTRPDAQLVFLDTPGIHRTDRLFNRRIVDVALSALADADLILLIVDAARPDPESEAMLLRRLAGSNRPVLLVPNKIDRVARPDLLALVEKWAGRRRFDAVVPVSALRGTQVERLVDEMAGLLPAGHPFFPDDTLTDVPMRFVVAERIREKVMRATGEEIPYAVVVTVDTFEAPPEGGTTRIHATIHVERDSQKGIVIGKGGAKLRQIGEAARGEIEALIGSKVYLRLFVRVQKNWSRDTRALRKFGY